MRRRQLLQLKNSEITNNPPAQEFVPITAIPQEVLDKVEAIRSGLQSGKKICDKCMRLFDNQKGLRMHQARWCK